MPKNSAAFDGDPKWSRIWAFVMLTPVIQAHLTVRSKHPLTQRCDYPNMSIGKRIKERLEELEDEVDVADVAKACGVSKQAVYQWISGSSKSLKGDNLVAVAKVLRVDPGWLSTGKGMAAQEEQAPYDVITPAAKEVAQAWMKLPPALQSSLRTMIFSSAAAHSVARWLVIDAPKGDGYQAWERAIENAYKAEVRQMKLDFEGR